MRIAVFYASRDGHTERVARHVATELRARDVDADVLDVGELAGPISFAPYDAVLLAASVHLGRHAREMVGFVRRYRDALDVLPTGFLSVSLSEAGAEDSRATPAERLAAADDVRAMLASFFHETGWHPWRVMPVAGALLYTRYNFLVRFLIRRIAAAHHAPTDTTRDFDLTDWVALERFIDEFVAALPPPHPELRAPTP